jgi:D-apionolactonase
MNDRLLRAGPLSMIFDNGDLRYIRLGDREVIRRIYVAVRDRSWRTIDTHLSSIAFDVHNDSFNITYDAENVDGEIDFFWKCEIRGDSQGSLAMSMNGVARSTFWRNRIGFCVLHPIRECAAARCRVEHAEKGMIDDYFPRLISPTAPFEEIKSISHEVTPDVWAKLQFEGDLFEMEDQRNWTDASFKTFCTPLRLPYPIEIVEGETVRQSVELELQGQARTQIRTGNERVSFRIEDAPPRALPAIGLGLSQHGPRLSPPQVKRLRALRLSHLRVDLSLSDSTYEESLQRAADDANQLGLRLEAALFVSNDAETQMTQFFNLLQKSRPQIARWLVFDAHETFITRELVQIARKVLGKYNVLGKYDSEIPIGGGTNHYFTELNRGRPPADLLDIVCYSANPQVHAFDDRSLVETLEAQAATVDSARQFSGGKPVSITPITLRPRFNPHAGIDDASDDDALTIDPRQRSLFGASWTLGSLKYVSESGVQSVTYYETTGGNGVMEADVFPLYHVLADVGEFAGGSIVKSRSSDPLRVDGLVLEKAGQRRMLIANMTDAPQHVLVSPGVKTVSLRQIEQCDVECATQSPEAFRETAGKTVEVGHHGLDIELSPFATIRLDWEYRAVGG